MSPIARSLVKKYLAKQAKRHAETERQLVCFSYDYITTMILLEGQYEREELICLERHCFPKMRHRKTCLDIGANIGNHTLFFSDHFETVIAFEPHPRTFKVLKLNAELAGNVETHNIGLSNKAGKVGVGQDKLNLAKTSLEHGGGANGEVVFKLERLDDFIVARDFKTIDFIKIDVEGHEAATLRGAEQTLKTYNPIVALEVLKADIVDGFTESLRILNTYGYRHLYQMRASGGVQNLPRPLTRFLTACAGVINIAVPKNYVLEPITTLGNQNHHMVLAAKTPL